MNLGQRYCVGATFRIQIPNLITFHPCSRLSGLLQSPPTWSLCFYPCAPWYIFRITLAECVLDCITPRLKSLSYCPIFLREKSQGLQTDYMGPQFVATQGPADLISSDPSCHSPTMLLQSRRPRVCWPIDSSWISAHSGPPWALMLSAASPPPPPQT